MIRLLELNREPENLYDPNGILLLNSKENELGCVPAVHNKNFAKELDAEEQVKSILLKVDTTAKVNQLQIEVFVGGA